MPIPPDDPYAAAMLKCGVKPDLADVEWDDVCQEDVFTFALRSVSEETLNRLAELYLTFPSRFVFEGETLQQAFRSAVSQTSTVREAQSDLEAHQDTKLVQRGLSSFRPWALGTETVEEFAVRAELACGFAAGEALESAESGALFLKSGASRSSGDFEALLSLLSRRAQGLRVSLIGRSAG